MVNAPPKPLVPHLIANLGWGAIGNWGWGAKK